MTPPVLILGCVTRIAVSVARSLARRGIPVDIATFSVQEINPQSRAVRRFALLPSPDDSPHDFVRALTGLIHRERYDLLIPGNDVAFTGVMEHFAEISKLVRVASPPPAIVERVLDKRLTLQAAERCKVRFPRTKLIANSAQIHAAADELGFPLVLKPARKMREEEFKVLTIQNAAHIHKQFPENRVFEAPLLAQEYCEGTGVGVELLVHNGECIAAFQHQREKEFRGVSVVARSQPPDSQLLRQSIALLRELEWEGIAMVEFRVPEHGEASLLEVNGRYWGTVSLPIACGIDFPWYQWQLLHGQKSVPNAVAASRRWRWTAGYVRRFHSLLLAALSSAEGRRQLWREIRNVSSDFDAEVHDSIWNSSDPLPALLEFFDAIRDILISDFRFLFRGRSQARPAAGSNVKQLSSTVK